MAQAVAGQAAAEAATGPLHTVGDIVHVEPEHGALHGAEGFVHIQAGPVVRARQGLTSQAAGVSVTDELLAG